MSRVFTPYQLDKDTEHLLNQLVVYLCVCGGGWGGGETLYLTLSNPTNLKSIWCLIWLSSVKSQKIKSKSHSKGGPLECPHFSKC